MAGKKLNLVNLGAKWKCWDYCGSAIFWIPTLGQLPLAMVMPRCRGKNRFGLNRIESQLVGILVGPLPVASPVDFNPLVQINRLRRCIYRCSYKWIHLHIFSVNWVILATQRWNPKSNGVFLIHPILAGFLIFLPSNLSAESWKWPTQKRSVRFPAFIDTTCQRWWITWPTAPGLMHPYSHPCAHQSSQVALHRPCPWELEVVGGIPVTFPWGVWKGPERWENLFCFKIKTIPNPSGKWRLK